MNSFFEPDDIITIYTRAAIIEDGTLKEISKDIVTQAALPYHTAITKTAMGKIKSLNDNPIEENILFVLTEYKTALKKALKGDGYYYTIFFKAGELELRAVLEGNDGTIPHDTKSNFLTILLPHED